MKPKYQQLYDQMLKEIADCCAGTTTEYQKAEQSFWIAQDYYKKLKAAIGKTAFKNELEEIEFFRKVKPRFTAYMEYFVNLIGVLPYIPQHAERARDFWEEEMQRYSRFYNRNKEFIDYYNSGHSDRDREYFLRSQNKLNIDHKAIAFDGDASFTTSHDGLVRSLIAYKMYVEYIETRLMELNESKPLSEFLKNK